MPLTASQRKKRKLKHWRNRLILDYGGQCVYCKRRLTIRPDGVSVPSLTDFTFDHAVPRSKGGRNNLCNYLPACYRCNLARGPRPAALPINWPSLPIGETVWC